LAIKNQNKIVFQGEKPYMCSICGLQFSRSDFLKNHSFSHTNERPFHCHICGKGFKMNHSLQVHMKNHQTDTITSTIESVCRRVWSYFSDNENDSTNELGITINTNNTFDSHVDESNHISNFVLSHDMTSALDDVF
jgi:hypothetical protein